MVELIVVMVLIGVVAAIAAPRLMDDGSTAAAAFAGQVVSALRYAQKSAVSHRRLVCATLTTTQVTLRIATNPGATACDADLQSPGDDVYSRTDTAVTTSYGAAGAGPWNLFFRPDGTIGTTATGGQLPPADPSTQGVTIRLHGIVQRNIQLDGATGYVD